MKINEILTEHYVNAFKADQKKPYADEVWELIQAAYKSIGGIKGSGFGSVDDMIKKIPFWKLVVRNGKVKCVQLYKDTNGRKMVAGATDGTREGKLELAKIMGDDLKRGYGEISHAVERFVMKNFPEAFEKYKIPAEEAGKILGKTVKPSKDGFHYTREINGEPIEKIMIGSPGKPIVFYE